MLSSRIESGELTELAARKTHREMRLHPRDLPRLAKFVVRHNGAAFEGSNEASAWLAADIRFDDGPEGFPRVHLVITGNLTLECRCCLQPVTWQVELETRLTVLSTEAQTSQVEDPFDSILIGGNGLSMQTIVEDEILAALPMAPVHGPGSECAESGGGGVDSGCDAESMSRPFADLMSLMGRAERKRID